jgi:hypothetical protein
VQYASRDFELRQEESDAKAPAQQRMSTDAAPARIFISYRRDDASGHAGRLYDDLTERFGEDRVFMDIDTIEPGVDFGDSIEQALDRCEVVLAVIGKSWVKISDSAGLRRLDNPDDYVRMELEASLARGIRVIPVRVQGAPMPSSTELPEGLARLARRQAVELSDHRWRYDVSVLVAAIERAAGEQAQQPQPQPSPLDKAPEGGDGSPEHIDAESRDGGLAVAPASAGGRHSYRPVLAVLGAAVAIGLVAVASVLIIQSRGDDGDVDEGPRATERTGTTRTVSLVERLIPPGEPYRCVSPFHRDHDDRMTMLLQFPDGRELNFVSNGPGDTSDAFLFCGGSAFKNLPGLASGPLRFESASPESVTSISGVYGRDFDAGDEERSVSLTTEVAGDRVCASRTDGAGHARRFTCDLPDGTSLADVVLRLDVERDRRFSVFAGIGNLRVELGS